MTFARVRGVAPATGLTVLGWVYLALIGPSVNVPFQEHGIPSPLIWPAVAALSTVLTGVSQLHEWEARAKRRLLSYRVAVLLISLVANQIAAKLLVSTYAQTPLLVWFFTLQSIALACSVLMGEDAWLPLSAFVLVAMFELGQDNSAVLRFIEGSPDLVLTMAVAAYTALAVVSLARTTKRSG